MKSIWGIAFVFVILALPLMSAFDWDNNVVAFWDLDGTTPTDSLGKHNGTNYGATTGLQGVQEKCFNFSGTDGDYVQVPDSDNLSFINATQDTPFSVSFWTDVWATNNQYFISKGNASVGYTEWSVFTTSDYITVFIYDLQQDYIGRRTSVQLKTDLNHIVITYNGNMSSSGIAIYVNGTRRDTTDQNSGTYGGMVNNNSPLYFGKQHVPAPYLNATLDEIGLFNKTLNSSEITELYASGYGITYGEQLTSQLRLCGTSFQNYTVDFLNFTFKDEVTDADLNASFIMDIYYWQVGGLYKTLSFTNVSENAGYGFCYQDEDEVAVYTMNVSYYAAGYPQRSQSFLGSISNIVTEKTLYLLANADGIYSSINVIDAYGTVIPNVLVTIERQINGEWVTVGEGYTGADGTITFWVNPNSAHRITAIKSGYTTVIVTITPTQTLYTLTMGGLSGGNATYTSQIPGLRWWVHPQIGPLVPGLHNFNATVTSTESNLEGCKLEILNATNISQILDSNESSAINTSYCYNALDYLTVRDQNLFGRLSVDTDNTTGYIIVDSDYMWWLMDKNITKWRGIPSFFEDFKDISEFGDGNEGEFAKFVLFFFFATLAIGFVCFFTGAEIQSPAITTFIIWIIIVVASAGGFLSFNSGSDQVNSWLEQYGFALIFFFFFLGNFFNTIRRDMQ